MPRFFISAVHKTPPTPSMPDGAFAITGDDAHHIAYSLRMRCGDTLTLCDMQRKEYQCEIVAFDRDAGGRKSDVVVTAKILSSRQTDTEPTYRAVLFQALPKAGKLDGIIQKAVETGVSDIVPFVSERCVSRPDGESAQKKLARWQKIAAEAAMQCGRGEIPTVRDVVSYEEAIRLAGECELSFLCYEGDGTLPLGEILRNGGRPATVAFVIGSEGGFSSAEAEFARNAGLHLAGLGKRILRCETASAFVLSCLTYHYDL